MHQMIKSNLSSFFRIIALIATISCSSDQNESFLNSDTVTVEVDESILYSPDLLNAIPNNVQSASVGLANAYCNDSMCQIKIPTSYGSMTIGELQQFTNTFDGRIKITIESDDNNSGMPDVYNCKPGDICSDFPLPSLIDPDDGSSKNLSDLNDGNSRPQLASRSPNSQNPLPSQTLDLSPYIKIDIPVVQFDFSPFIKKEQEAIESAVRAVEQQQAAYQSSLLILLTYRSNLGNVFSSFRQKIADLVVGSDDDVKSNAADTKFAASLIAATRQISQKQDRVEKRKAALDAAKKNLPKDVPAGYNNLKSPPSTPLGQQIRNQLLELDKIKSTPGISEAEQSYIAKAEDLIKKADQLSDDQSGQEAKNLLILAQEYIDMAGRKNVNWKDASRKKVECPQKQITPRERNRLISAEYAALYLSDPSVYKWAGMAAFASDLVGTGIQFGEFLKYYPDYANVVQQTEEFLAAGNAAVFNDIYWQHEAYRVGGIEEMKRLAAAQEMLPAQLAAWELIDKGSKNGDVDMIWLGNKKLLRFEQFVTLQPIYEKFPDLSKLMSPFMFSPVPGNWDPFQVAVPLGNIGDKNDRWNWISESMLPSWKTLSDKDRGTAVSDLSDIVENSKGVCKQ